LRHAGLPSIFEGAPVRTSHHIEFSACLTPGTAGPHRDDMNLKPIEAAKEQP
jgi:hypothetical protein